MKNSNTIDNAFGMRTCPLVIILMPFMLITLLWCQVQYLLPISLALGNVYFAICRGLSIVLATLACHLITYLTIRTKINQTNKDIIQKNTIDTTRSDMQLLIDRVRSNTKKFPRCEITLKENKGNILLALLVLLTLNLFVLITETMTFTHTWPTFTMALMITVLIFCAFAYLSCYQAQRHQTA